MPYGNKVYHYLPMGGYKMEYEYLDFRNMYKGLKRSCKNVRWKTSVTQFEMNGLKNTAKSIRNIKTGKYRLSKYQKFIIYEPKLRHITATRIVDRQIQRSLCDTTIYRLLTKSFIYSNAACQVGKGTDFALNDFKKQLRKHYQHYGTDGYYLKCDVHHFFESINHDILKEKLRKKISDKHILFMLFEVIDSFGEVGLGLGSQISQLLALFYLDEMDHYIKEKLKIKTYTRYMDDFILVSNNKQTLLLAKQFINKHLQSLKLSLNHKTTLQKVSYGIMYLQWKFIITNTGKILMLVSAKRETKRRHKLKRLLHNYIQGTLSPENFYTFLQSSKAYLDKGNTYLIISKLNYFI